MSAEPDDTDAPVPPLRVVLCWHMHQPSYADLAGGDYALPWTYLHAIKDYVDMAAILDDGALAADLARRGRLRAAEASWARTAELTAAAYREAAA